MVAVCATLAWIIGGDVLVGLRLQVAGAATFSYNWVAVAAGTTYFDASTPEVFRNLWSLAVEEQFYVVWPLLLPLLLLLPGRWLRAGVALLLAAASTLWAATLLGSGADLTRVYYGTDTHAFGLLLGVALAFGLQGLRAVDGTARVDRGRGTGMGSARRYGRARRRGRAGRDRTDRGVVPGGVGRGIRAHHRRDPRRRVAGLLVRARARRAAAAVDR